MKTDPIPAHWDTLLSPSIPYWWGMDILESHWERTKPYAEDDPGSSTFQEYLFWRRVSVIWTCSTIEAFVNDEGVAWLGSDFYKDSIERLRIIQKIDVLYALKYRARLPRKLPELQQVQKLFDLRNSIIHPKTQELSGGDGCEKVPLNELHTMEFQHLRKMFWTVTALFEPAGEGARDAEQETEEHVPG